ncbi:MAG: LPS-assembly protein LptD [Rhodosalinus sp.]
MRAALCAAALALALVFAPARASAQNAAPDPSAILLADRIWLEGDDRLVAEGAIEVMQGERRLTARRVIYDAGAERLQIEGPMRLTEGDADTVLVADSAALDRDLTEGILRSARVVLDRQLQLAAARADRVAGRYTVLTNTSVTSCQVCARGRGPLWQIRARQVIHDTEARQLYFDGAQLRVLDVPVFYLPRLRLPDPTLARARGFLTPAIRSTTRLGVGLTLPYFIPIGAHRDLTLTPYLSPRTRTMRLRYRQAFAHGRIETTGAASADTLRRGEARGYLFAEGAFDLGRGYRLSFDLESTSDKAYLTDYGFSEKDRLDSEILLSRVHRDGILEAGLVHYTSLRDNEDNATQPSLVLDVRHERLVSPRLAGGQLRLFSGLHAHYRSSDRDVAGRDMARLSAGAEWTRRWTAPAGIRLGVRAGLRADSARIRQDSTTDTGDTRLAPEGAIELRWPLSRSGRGGAAHLLEPVAMVAWSAVDRPDIPNDASTRVELDEGNLLALSRFPATDRRERGWRGAAGLRWLRHDPDGWSLGATVGQVWRAEAEAEFSSTSGLDGTRSDLLVATQLDLSEGLRLDARGLFGPGFDVARAATRARWRTERLDLAATYLLLPRDPAENRPETLSEWGFDGSYRLARHWTGAAEWRYDIAADRTAEAGLGIAYRNECVEVRLSASRSFASSANLDPGTDFGLTIALKGFSTGGSAKEYRRTCN